MTTSISILGGMIVLFILSTLIPDGAFPNWPLLHHLAVFFQLDRFYSSFIFYVLLLLLFSNITICSSKHSLKLLQRFLREGTSILTPRYFRSVGIQLIHLGIILVFVASVTKHFLAKDYNVSLPEGANYTLPDQQHHIRLNHFQILLDKNRDLKNYESDLSIFNIHGQEIERKKLSVNHLIKVGDYRLYQAYYGKAFGLTLTNRQHDKKELTLQEGQTIEIGPTTHVFLYQYFPDFSGGTGFDSTSLSSEDRNPVLWLILKGEKPQSFILPKGNSVDIDGHQLQFNDLQSYSGIKVVKDPSVPWMGAAFLLLTLGFLVIFYIPKEDV